MSDVTFAEKLDLKHRIEPSDVLALLSEPKMTRRDVARAYGLMIQEHFNGHGMDPLPNVAALNNAILAHWSISGLEWIKREAWAIAEGRR